MNPNRPRKEKPAWLKATEKNKAWRPKVAARPSREQRIEALNRIVSDLSIPFHKRKPAADELAALLEKEKIGGHAKNA